MAYYSSDYYEIDPAYYQNPYDNSYDTVQSPPLTCYPNGYNDYNLFDCPPTSYYYGCYDSAPSPSIVSYSAYTFSEPKYIEYAPHFTISHAVSEFNLPDFEEYDPTPYGGGFDLDQVYGKSLPPSEETCYPRSSIDSSAPSSNGFSSTPTPYEKEEAVEPAAKASDDIKPVPVKEGDQDQPQQQQQQHQEIPGDNEPEPASVKPFESVEVQEKESYEDDQDQEYGHLYGYDYGRIVSEAPPGYGYGYESLDICEGLFGYWPCLNRDGRRHDYSHQQDAAVNVERYDSNQWKEDTAEYIFGSSYPYSERRDAIGSYESVIYGYERHYQQHSLLYKQQLPFGEDSWNVESNLL